MPRRKFEYTLPDDSKMHANLCIEVMDNGDPESGGESFEIECDGKLLLDGRYVPCKERNLVMLPSLDNDTYQKVMP